MTLFLRRGLRVRLEIICFREGRINEEGSIEVCDVACRILTNGNGFDAVCASRRGHVDVRQFSVQDSADQVWFRAFAVLAGSCAPVVAAYCRGMLGVVYFFAGTGDDESSLRGGLRGGIIYPEAEFRGRRICGEDCRRGAQVRCV